MAVSGIKPKDSPFTDGFNSSKNIPGRERELSRLEKIAMLKREAMGGADGEVPLVPSDVKRKPGRPKGSKERKRPDNVKKGYGGYGDEVHPGGENGTPPPDPSPAPAPDSLGLDPTSYQLLSDLREAYNSQKGNKKLLDLMSDDKEFKFIVKELLKIELALLQAKIKQKGGDESNERGFFVVLKGLETESDGIKRAGADSGLDLRQIENSLNPASTIDLESWDKEEDRAQGDGKLANEPEGW